MKEKSKELLSWKEKLNEKALPAWEEIPDIGLYMDQVITLMESYLSAFEGTHDEDKTITPSMINNYVKMEIVPPPQKKKYNREQITLLISVCVLKQIISISEIKAILDFKLKRMSVKEWYISFRDMVNQANGYISSIINELSAGSSKSVNENRLTDIAVLFAIFANMGKMTAKKIIGFEHSAKESDQKADKKQEKSDKKKKEKN